MRAHAKVSGTSGAAVTSGPNDSTSIDISKEGA